MSLKIIYGKSGTGKSTYKMCIRDRDNVINVKKVDNTVYFTSLGADNLKNLVDDYFDLGRDYEKIKETLSEIDEYLENSIIFIIKSCQKGRPFLTTKNIVKKGRPF